MRIVQLLACRSDNWMLRDLYLGYAIYMKRTYLIRGEELQHPRHPQGADGGRGSILLVCAFSVPARSVKEKFHN